MTEPWTTAKLLAWAADDLKGRGHESPRLDAELILSLVLGCDRIKLFTDPSRPMTPEELGVYKALHIRRRRGEPIAYLLSLIHI